MTSAFLAAIGVRVIEIEQLGQQGIYLRNARILLIDLSLDDDAKAAVAERALGDMAIR